MTPGPDASAEVSRYNREVYVMQNGCPTLGGGCITIAILKQVRVY